MIRHLYSGRYNPTLGDIESHRVALTVLHRVLR